MNILLEKLTSTYFEAGLALFKSVASRVPENQATTLAHPVLQYSNKTRFMAEGFYFMPPFGHGDSLESKL